MNKVIQYYELFDEWGRLDREPLEFLVNWHFIKKHLNPGSTILDNGAGPGKYAMKLAEEGYKISLSDITPRLVETAKQKAEEFNLVDQFEGFHVADARKLDCFSDEQFDSALMLGPMYHLQSDDDQRKAISELYRVTKKGGIVYVAFMSRVRHMLNSLIRPQMWRPNDQMDRINDFMETGCFNHADEGRFTGAYYFNIKDINPFMEELGFETIDLIGSNIGSFMNSESLEHWESKGESEMEELKKLLINYASDPHLLGVSSHLLYIGRK